ncbi:Beta-barrel assembly machine subunit BamE [Cricetibacter osteomyelitidis]|uniref:Beta-barrel assembly machine subunit BamE n=1 Tax=Cricetibacter osteomyelitidis TaxID=1521931 RepID=A0A4V2T145_9PAST|nr:OmpA family protein [Cricetibacter osteomyelitidis]TCP92163.1 Beta-barrel assembly machine subunit BamE [Cricetibacter osteomyelitidis]
MKLSSYLLTAVAAVSLAACGNLSKVSDEGTTDKPVWPKIESSTFSSFGTQYGSWPNWDNVNTIEKGMNKEQIRQLVGDPQFAEGLFGVREWDYVFNYREHGEHKICQYKVLFDKNGEAQSFFWLPESCNVKHGDNIDMSADFIFDFNKDTLSAGGQRILTNVAKILSNTTQSFTINGYADRLGSDVANLKLSQRRAERVKNELITLGIEPARITSVVGHGKADQVKACNDQSGAELRECLRPNRRVVIELVK